MRRRLVIHRGMYCLALLFTSILLSIPPVTVTAKVEEPPERPFYQTKMFQPNITHKKNWCGLHKQVNEGTISIRDVLQNSTISVAVYDFITNEDLSISNTDLGVLVLDELAARAGFTWRNAYGILDRPDGNETFDSVLDWSKNVYDITAEWYVVTPARLERSVIYPGWWFDASYILVQKSDINKGPDIKFSLFAFGTPFKREVWFLIGITVLITALLTFLIDYIDGRRLGKKSQEKPSLSMTCFNTSMALLGQLPDYNPKSVPTAIITFSSALMFVLVLSSYTANLTSFLVVSRQSKESVSDLNDIVGRDKRICVKLGTAMDTYVTTAFPSYKKIKRILVRNEMYMALNDGKCDYLFTTKDVWNAKKFDIKANPDCNLEQVGRTLEVFEASFPMGDSMELCTSILKDALTFHLSEMKVDGKLEEIKSRYFLDIQTNDCDDDDSEEEEEGEVKLGISSMGGIFLFHAALLLVALLWSVLAGLTQPRMRREMSMILSSRRLIIDSDDDDDASENKQSLNLAEFKQEMMELVSGLQRNYLVDLNRIRNKMDDDMDSIRAKIGTIRDGGGNGVGDDDASQLSMDLSLGSRSVKSAKSLPLKLSETDIKNTFSLAPPMEDPRGKSMGDLPRVSFRLDNLTSL